MSDIRLNHAQLAMVDLDTLPGGTELYVELAQVFLHAYEGHDDAYEQCWCHMTEQQISDTAQRLRARQSAV